MEKEIKLEIEKISKSAKKLWGEEIICSSCGLKVKIKGNYYECSECGLLVEELHPITKWRFYLIKFIYAM